MAAESDPNVVPDNIAKARAIVQLMRSAIGSNVAFDDGALDAALWAVEDLLTEASDVRLSIDLARAACAPRGPPTD